MQAHVSETIMYVGKILPTLPILTKWQPLFHPSVVPLKCPSFLLNQIPPPYLRSHAFPPTFLRISCCLSLPHSSLWWYFFLSALNHTWVFSTLQNPFLQLLPYLLLPVTARLGDVVLTSSISLPSSSIIPITTPLNLLLPRSLVFPMPFNLMDPLVSLCDLLACSGYCLPPSFSELFPGLPAATVCWDSSYLLPSQSQTPSLLLNPSRQHPRTAVSYIWYTLLDGLINPHGSHYHWWPTHASLFSPCELQMHVFIPVTHWDGLSPQTQQSVQSLTWSKW